MTCNNATLVRKRAAASPQLVLSADWNQDSKGASPNPESSLVFLSDPTPACLVDAARDQERDGKEQGAEEHGLLESEPGLEQTDPEQAEDTGRLHRQPPEPKQLG